MQLNCVLTLLLNQFSFKHSPGKLNQQVKSEQATQLVHGVPAYDDV